MATRAIGKGHPRKFDVDRVPGQPKKRRKVTLVFDEQKRREFLGGFHKRKLQRKKKAAEELQQKLKEEKKRIKHDAREKFKTLLSQRDIPELEELWLKREYEDEERTVSILELDVADLAQRSNSIGTNQPVYEDDKETKESEGEENSEEEEVTGMELKRKVMEIRPKVDKNTSDKRKTGQGVRKEPETKKEVARAVKRAALKQVNNSKVFLQKQRLERQKNKKRSNQLKMRQEKVLKKSRGKIKKKSKK